jgi:hypothetical protein
MSDGLRGKRGVPLTITRSAARCPSRRPSCFIVAAVIFYALLGR